MVLECSYLANNTRGDLMKKQYDDKDLLYVELGYVPEIHEHNDGRLELVAMRLPGSIQNMMVFMNPDQIATSQERLEAKEYDRLQAKAELLRENALLRAEARAEMNKEIAREARAEFLKETRDQSGVKL